MFKFKATILIVSLFILPCCANDYNVLVDKQKIKFPDLKFEKEDINIQNVKFIQNEDKICLTKQEADKLLQNINNIKIAYYKNVENYKIAVDSYNELKRIAYE